MRESPLTRMPTAAPKMAPKTFLRYLQTGTSLSLDSKSSRVIPDLVSLSIRGNICVAFSSRGTKGGDESSAKHLSSWGRYSGAALRENIIVAGTGVGGLCASLVLADDASDSARA